VASWQCKYEVRNLGPVPHLASSNDHRDARQDDTGAGFASAEGGVRGVRSGVGSAEAGAPSSLKQKGEEDKQKGKEALLGLYTVLLCRLWPLSLQSNLTWRQLPASFKSALVTPFEVEPSTRTASVSATERTCARVSGSCLLA
jgi:hypothetical protein